LIDCFCTLFRGGVNDQRTAVRYIVAAAAEYVRLGRFHSLHSNARATNGVALTSARTTEMVLQAGLAAHRTLRNTRASSSVSK